MKWMLIFFILIKNVSASHLPDLEERPAFKTANPAQGSLPEETQKLFSSFTSPCQNPLEEKTLSSIEKNILCTMLILSLADRFNFSPPLQAKNSFFSQEKVPYPPFKRRKKETKRFFRY